MLAKAQRLYGTRDLRYMDVEFPELGGQDVLIRVIRCGICGTDYSIYTGQASFIAAGMVHYPLTMGHEYSGVVEAVGKDVTKFRPGDKIVADTAVSCCICQECLEGNFMRCKNSRSVGTINTIDGAYAQYAIMPQRHIFPLPEAVSFDQGALAEPGATALNAVDMCRVEMGDTMLIIGTGPIGLSAVPFARYSGAARVVLAGRKAFKLKTGEKLGADELVDTTREDLYERVMKMTRGKGADVVVEASGSHEMLGTALRASRMGARIALVAFYDRPVDAMDIDALILKDQFLMPVLGSPNKIPRVLKMMESGRVDLTPLITHRYPLSQTREALEAMGRGEEGRIKAMLELDKDDLG